MVSKITTAQTPLEQVGTINDVIDELSNKQATLVSGTNIKTINSQSLLGSGNVDIIQDVFKLFHHDWFDYELTDQSWLRADTFSWQDGTVYTNAYNHLVSEWDTWWQSHTIADLQFDGSLAFAVMPDGHRICGGNTSSFQEQEGYLINLYNSKGVAWYYLIDTDNQRFKLPRTKFGFTGLRDTVGKYVEAGIPNITGSFSGGVGGATGAFYDGGTVGNGFYNTQAQCRTKQFEASRSSSIYGNSTTVQPPATQMYLYFYVGQFSQSATEQTAGLNASLFNGKADLDFNNMNPSSTAKQTIVSWGMPDYSSGVSKSDNTEYTAATNGWLEIFTSCYNSTAQASLIINGISREINVTLVSHVNVCYCIVPIPKNATYKVVYSRVSADQYINFYPCLGG